jgi:anti-repressor protein
MTVYGTADAPLFLAKDVAKWIGYSTTHCGDMLRNVADNEKRKAFCTLINDEKPSEIGVYNAANRWFLTEDGLYEVIMQSRMPKAQQFKNAVKKILTQIRRTGGYIPVEKGMSDSDILSKAVLIAQRTIEQQNSRIEELEAEANESRPMVAYAKAVSDSNDGMLIRTFAKIARQSGIIIGEKRLFSWLRDKGYLLTNGEAQNTPSQEMLEKKWFYIKETVVSSAGSAPKTRVTPKITGKGRIALLQKLREDESVDKVLDKV